MNVIDKCFVAMITYMHHLSLEEFRTTTDNYRMIELCKLNL